MHWDVVEVRPEGGCSLWVRFADGVSGVIRLEPADLTGVLAPLHDLEFFRSVYIDHGAVSRPEEIDLAPDAMYKEIQDSNRGAHLLLDDFTVAKRLGDRKD